MQLRRSDVGSPLRIHQDGLFESLVIALADEGQALVLRASCVLAGEINRYIIPLMQLLAKLLGEFFAILNGNVFSRVDLDGIHGPDTRVAAVLLSHVDELVRLAGRVEQCLFHGLGPTYQLGRQAVELPGTLTYSVLPQRPYSRDIAGLAHRNGKEVMLHLPMESLRGKRLGPGALTADMQVRFRIVQGLDATTQHINFDNVDIAYSGTGIGGSGSVSAATASSSIRSIFFSVTSMRSPVRSTST